MKFCLLKVFLPITYLFCLFFITNGQATKNAAEITLCAIESNPEAFIEKQLDVRAIYFVGFEMGWLEDVGSCEKTIKRQFRISYKFDENFNANTKTKALRQMNKILGKKIKEPFGPRKVPGWYTIQISKHKKKNENENLYDYDIVILKLISIDEEKN